MRKNLCVTLGLLVAVPTATLAQVVPHRFQVSPRAAVMNFQEASGLKSAGLVGLDATYFFTRNLGLGASMEFSRPQTDGRFFPAEMSFGDTTFTLQVSQPVTVWHYQLQAVATIGTGSISPFVTAGWGQYRLFLDPQAAREARTVTHGLLTFGGGVNLKLGASSGLRFEIRDDVYRDYDLNEINLVEARFAPRRFPDSVQIPDRKCYDGKCSLSNWQFALGFSFVPGGR